MSEILVGLKNEYVLVFIDYTICYSSDLESHLVKIRQMYEC